MTENAYLWHYNRFSVIMVNNFRKDQNSSTYENGEFISREMSIFIITTETYLE